MSYLNELAVSVHRQKGVFALLLGSGLSRAARVPTGWDITLNLVKQLATAEGDEPKDLATWYRDTYGGEPDYSELLEHIAPTEAERRGILESYFEPNEQEREQGYKLPTAAHKAIARLVAKGYIRVILTTNFDRLLEQALSDEGIAPTVISSSDAVQGAPPYVHTPLTIIKLHGDYKDTRIKNSVAELAAYDDVMNLYLDRVLDEFGLIVAGWSGDWDAALRAAVLRMANRRYSLYWLAYSTPSALAQELIDFRKGRVIEGLTADQFFERLLGKEEALEDSAWSSPQDVNVMLAEVKRYLAEPERFGIRLEELITEETKTLARVMQEDSEACPWSLYPEDAETCRRCVEYLEIKSERLTRLLSTIVRYDRAEVWSTTIAKVVGLLAKEPSPSQFNRIGRFIRLYPIRLVTTALCAIASQEERVTTLQKIQDLPYRRRNIEVPFFYILHELEEQKDAISAVVGRETFYPFATRTSEVLTPWLEPLLITSTPYYDQGEFVLSLAAMDVGRRRNEGYWTPIGGVYMHYGSDSIEKLVKHKPAWFSELFPDLSGIAEVFDNSAERSGRGFWGNTIRLGPLLEQE